MPFVANFPFFCILFTMAGGIVSSILKGKKAFYLNVFVSLACTLMSLSLLIYLNYYPQQFYYMMGHFPAPWGNEISFGPLEALIATVLSTVMLLIVISERSRIFFNVKPKKVNLFYLMMNLLLSSLFALTYTNDLFTAYVFIEINTLCACGLIVAKENGKTVGVAIKYLLMSLLGSGLYLVSIILLYDLTGHLLLPNVHNSLEELVASGAYSQPITMIAGLMAVGIAIKSALFPFHTWMSQTYNSAMNGVNAISSGLVVKGYVILLIKIFYEVFGLDLVHELNIANVLLIFGTLAIIIGSIDALREQNIKRILAYSSVGQMGYIYVGIGLATTDGMLAACFVIISHSLTKSMMFLACEGLMLSSYNSKYISILKGSAYRNPLSALALTVGALSIVGIPLFPGFVSKYLLALAAIEDGAFTWVVLGAIAFSTVMNAVYFFRIIMSIYTKDEAHAVRYKNDKNYSFALSIFIVLNISLGILYEPIIEIINKGLSVL